MLSSVHITGLDRRAQPMPVEKPFYLPAISTISLGLAGKYGLEEKLKAAKRHGFLAVEINYMDLLHYTDDNIGRVRSVDVYFAARLVRQQCEKLNIKILSLQPFELGRISTDSEREERLNRFHTWLDVAHILGTNVISITATDIPNTRGTAPIHTNLIILMLRMLSEAAARCKTPNMKIAYQNSCCSDRVQTWVDAYHIVQQVGRDNVQFLPNTFQIAGADWADPTTTDGKQPGADE